MRDQVLQIFDSLKGIYRISSSPTPTRNFLRRFCLPSHYKESLPDTEPTVPISLPHNYKGSSPVPIRSRSIHLYAYASNLQGMQKTYGIMFPPDSKR